MRKLVIKDWVHVSPGAFFGGMEGVWWVVEMKCTCLEGFLLGGSNAEKWCNHQKKNFFIDNSSGLPMCDSLIETAKYLWVNI